MNVHEAKKLASIATTHPLPGHILATRCLAREVDRLEAQLDSVRAELAATVANIAAWDEVLADVIPALHERMGND